MSWLLESTVNICAKLNIILKSFSLGQLSLLWKFELNWMSGCWEKFVWWVGGGWHSRIESLQVLLTLDFGLGLWQYSIVKIYFIFYWSVCIFPVTWHFVLNKSFSEDNPDQWNQRCLQTPEIIIFTLMLWELIITSIDQSSPPWLCFVRPWV